MILPGLNPPDAAELTLLEVNGRQKIRITLQFLKEHVPAFENCFLLDAASQRGAPGSRFSAFSHWAMIYKQFHYFKLSSLHLSFTG